MRDVRIESEYGWAYTDGGYDELIASFEVKTLLTHSDGDYSGDSWYLLQDGERLGILTFGWGSCSGCDSLQACSTKADFTELRDDLWQRVHWEPTQQDMLRYLTEHEWEGEFMWYEEEFRKFLDEAKHAVAPTEAR